MAGDSIGDHDDATRLAMKAMDVVNRMDAAKKVLYMIRPVTSEVNEARRLGVKFH